MMHFSDWRVGTRLGVGFGALIFLIIIMGSVAVLNLSGMNRNMAKVIEHEYPLTVDANALIDKLNEQTGSYQTLLLTAGQRNSEALLNTIQNTMGEVSRLMESLDKNLTDPISRQALANGAAIRADFLASAARVRQHIASHAQDAATREYIDVMQPVQKRYEAELVKLIDREDDLMVEAGEQVKASYQDTRLLMFCLIAAGSVLGIGIAMVMTRSVTRPLGEAVTLANRVAAGDLTSRIEHASKDETGQLLRALDAMNGSLRSIVERVRTGADSISSATAQIAAGNQDLSSRTEEQASSLEETAASMEQITATVKNNASSAGEANRLVDGAASLTQQSVSVMSEVSSTMTAISDASRRIAEIINVIDSIAFQTNILALNAAVEAARAGEQGRGFAVVASEVRNLAQRSATSAKEIKSLIDESVATVGRGSALVSQAENIVRDVGKGTEPVIAIVNEISQASREQSDGIDQINVAIAQIDATTQQNAALVEEAAAAALALREQAAELVGSISHFRTGQTDTASTVRSIRQLTAVPATASRPVENQPPTPAYRPAIRPTRNKPLALSAKSAQETAGNDDDWSTF
ncbi:methyl-accepting chemotaxis protein [Corticimicrobacter populi]|nr:methyl-accepting chemotaxis protein [Corticimicrobacter populi]